MVYSYSKLSQLVPVLHHILECEEISERILQRVPRKWRSSFDYFRLLSKPENHPGKKQARLTLLEASNTAAAREILHHSLKLPRHNRDDFVSEVLIKVQKAAKKYAKKASWQVYVSKIARNHAVDMLRKIRSTERNNVPLGGLPLSSKDFIAELLSNRERKELLDEIKRVWQSLSLNSRRVLEARYGMPGYFFIKPISHQNMAERFSLPLGTVKRRLHDAHKELIGLIGRKHH